MKAFTELHGTVIVRDCNPMHQPLFLAAEIEYSAMLCAAVVPESNGIIPPFESTMEVLFLGMTEQKIEQRPAFLLRHTLDM